MESQKGVGRLLHTFYIALLFLLLRHCSLVLSSLPSNAEDKVQRSAIRIRKQACQDGTYQHQGKTCCLCAAGQYLIKHCNAMPGDRVCKFCETGRTYNTVPNALDSCEPCTSCLQSVANLEVAKECTIVRNTECRCKDEHYCGSGGKDCVSCRSCDKCDTQGVKTPCTATNNTVCNNETKGNLAWLVVLVPVFAVAVALVVCWRKKLLCFRGGPPRTSQESQEMEILEAGELLPHLQDIADIIGWKAMKAVALKSNWQPAAIENYMLDHPNDGKERTLQLLMDWMQRTGSGAPKELIQKLKDVHSMGKAAEVMNIVKLRNIAA